MSYCSNCGAPMKDGARFCPNCGHQVNTPQGQSNESFWNAAAEPGEVVLSSWENPNPQPAPQPQVQQQSQPQYQPQAQPTQRRASSSQTKKKKKGGCCLVALIVLLVMLAALGIGGYFFYKFANDKFEDAKEMIEETIGVPLSSIISSENREELEKPVVTSEDIDKPNKAKKGKEGKKIAVKDEDFSGVTLPFPDMGVITNNFTDFGTQVYYFDQISYQQFIEYCKMLEALPGWVAHEKDNVAHFPKDYNEKMMTLCVGDYNGLHVVVKYLSDSFIEGTDMSHLSLQVKNKR